MRNFTKIYGNKIDKRIEMVLIVLLQLSYFSTICKLNSGNLLQNREKLRFEITTLCKKEIGERSFESFRSLTVGNDDM